MQQFNFWSLTFKGLVIGFLLVLIAIIFSCNEPPVQGKVHGRIDTFKTASKDSLLADSSLIIGRGTKTEPFKVNHDQRRQLKLLEEIRRDIIKLSTTDQQDTAYRHNILRIADTMYYAIIRKRKGEVKIQFNKSYTDNQLFIHDIPIDTIKP